MTAQRDEEDRVRPPRTTGGTAPWEHTHTFGQDVRRSGESRTRWVIGLTAATMLAEIAAGVAFGSMALLADGLHMASHATALTISAFAYAYARRHAANPDFSFGTGKVNALAGFTGAVLLATFAAIMAFESVQRLIEPTVIEYDQAILVAVLGLAVNGTSVLVLGADGHRHDHDTESHAHHHDHNLRAAYLHVLADALTSVLAIVALLFAKYAGIVWVDPLVGLVGAYLVARWSVGLLRETSDVLLDRQGPAALCERIRRAIEAGSEARIVDLHVWSIGSAGFAAVIGLVDREPRCASEYRALLPADLHLAHVSVEVYRLVVRDDE